MGRSSELFSPRGRLPTKRRWPRDDLGLKLDPYPLDDPHDVVGEPEVAGGEVMWLLERS